MENTAQERAPKMVFTTMRGGKGYVVDEVDAYIETIRNAYSELTQELDETLMNQAQSVAELAEERNAHGETRHRIAELTELLEKREAQMRRAETEYEQYRKNGDQLQGELATAKRELYEFKSRLEEQESENESLRQQVESDLKTIEKLGEELRMTIEQGDIWKQSAVEEQEELRKQLLEKEQELDKLGEDIEKLQEFQYIPEAGADDKYSAAPLSYAAQYVDIFETVRISADNYAFEVEKKMDALLAEAESTAAQQVAEAERTAEETVSAAREESEELMRNATAQAEDILRSAGADAEGITREAQLNSDNARKKAEETVQEAERRAEEALTRAREELATIRGLIEKASAVYQSLCSTKAQQDIEMI